MRVNPGVAQPCRDAIFQPLRDIVLQPLGLLMHFIPRVVEDVMQKPLQKAVVANHFERAAPARRAQPVSAGPLVPQVSLTPRCFSY